MPNKFADPNVTNIHYQHLASCLCCRHLTGSMGEGGYSDVTPSSPAFFDCLKGAFAFREDDDYEKWLFALHDYGFNCTKFAPRE